MIYQLCNQGYEQVATFYKIAVIKKSSLSAFTHLSSDATILDIITNLPEAANALIINLLPENVRVSYNTRANQSGKSYTAGVQFLVTPQDKNLQSLLNEYNNQEVVVLLDKYAATHIYGTPKSALTFIYNESHSNQGAGEKGYAVQISGECLGSSKIFENITFNIFNRGLAFELAGTL